MIAIMLLLLPFNMAINPFKKGSKSLVEKTRSTIKNIEGELKPLASRPSSSSFSENKFKSSQISEKSLHSFYKGEPLDLSPEIKHEPSKLPRLPSS